jgi:hypothetical protein
MKLLGRTSKTTFSKLSYSNFLYGLFLGVFRGTSNKIIDLAQ